MSASRTSSRLARVSLPSLALGATLWTALSCSSATESASETQVQPIEGESQIGLPGLQLRDSLSLRLTAGNGVPRAGQFVDWSVTGGGGSVTPTRTVTNANGVTSASWTLGALGAQTVSATAEGLSVGPVMFSATAVAPIVAVRYDGTSWRTELADTNLAKIRLAAVWGTSATDLFAVGSSSASGPLTMRLSGGTWSSARTIQVSSVGTVTAISGRGTSDVYTARSWALPPSGGREIAHFDGQSWTASYSDNCSFSCLDAVNSIWVSNGPDIFAVGNRGLVFHYDGAAWNPLVSGTTASLRGVWGAATNHVVAVGDNGVILVYDGGSWSAQASGVTQALNAVWGRSVTDVFAVGGGGTILHFDGSKWSIQNSNTSEDLFAIAGSGARVFAVGSNSTVLQYDGSQWRAQQLAMPIDLRGVWASEAQAVAVGGPPTR